MRKLFCLEAPMSHGQLKNGVALGPQHIVKSGLIANLSQFYQVTHKVTEFEPAQKVETVSDRSTAVANACEEIFGSVVNASRGGAACITLGGDHSVALGSISALASLHENLRVVWVDAHGDANTPQTSPSGNLHGMPVAGLLGAFDKIRMPEFGWLKHFIKPENIALVGVRALDKGERQFLRKMGVKIFTDSDVRGRGMKYVTDEIQQLLKLDEHPVHFSFDVDSLEPSLMPCTGTVEEGGLNLNEITQLCQFVALSRRLVGIDVVEFNPELNSQHAERCAKICTAMVEVLLCGKAIASLQEVA